MKSFFVCLSLLVTSAVFSQSSTDEAEVRKLVEELITSFNTHDFTSLKANSTDDVSWVNVMGKWWKGRDEVVNSHYEIFNKIFNGVKFEKQDLSIRFITPDVILVHVLQHVGAFFPPDGVDRGSNRRPEADNNLQLVYVRKDGKWMLSAAHNIEVAPPRPPANTGVSAKYRRS